MFVVDIVRTFIILGPIAFGYIDTKYKWSQQLKPCEIVPAATDITPVCPESQ